MSCFISSSSLLTAGTETSTRQEPMDLSKQDAGISLTVSEMLRDRPTYIVVEQSSSQADPPMPYGLAFGQNPYQWLKRSQETRRNEIGKFYNGVSSPLVRRLPPTQNIAPPTHKTRSLSDGSSFRPYTTLKYLHFREDSISTTPYSHLTQTKPIRDMPSDKSKRCKIVEVEYHNTDLRRYLGFHYEFDKRQELCQPTVDERARILQALPFANSIDRRAELIQEYYEIEVVYRREGKKKTIVSAKTVLKRTREQRGLRGRIFG